MIYYIKENIRVNVTTDKKIFFYVIDLNTLKPQLENVMMNYMGCTEMMVGAKVKYCITYKQNQKSFDIRKRRYIHDFKSTVNDTDFNRSL